jgi:uncharacterized membrane protein
MKRCSNLKTLLVVIVCVLVNLGGVSQAQTPSFSGIGGTSSLNQTHAIAISDDGSTIAGFTTSDWTGGAYGFRWTPFFGIEYIGRPPGSYLGETWLSDISGDGRIVVGMGRSWYYVFEGFLWEEGVGFLVSFPGRPNAISSSGLVVVGGASDGAWRWSADTGLAYLGSGIANDVSADGSVIVGEGGSAWRWTEGTGMVQLGGPGTNAFGVSADGAVAVGSGGGPSGTDAFRWTQATGMVGLGHLPEGTYSVANATSGDGSIVVGYSDLGGTDAEAFIWDPIYGMRNLRDVLVNELGLDLTGWSLRQVTDISPDGHTLVGYGYNPDGRGEGWIAVIPDLVRRINAAVDFNPDVLTLRSAIPQITCYIRLPAGYSVANIDLNSVLLNGQVLAASVQIDTKKQVATAKFNRSAMSGILVPGVVKLTVTGKLPSRTVFKGIGTITVQK